MIHGTYDQGQQDFGYLSLATDLNSSGKYFELKVYYGEPHGFMVQNGQALFRVSGKGCFLADGDVLQSDAALSILFGYFISFKFFLEPDQDPQLYHPHPLCPPISLQGHR